MVKHIMLNDLQAESFNKAKGEITTENPLEKITDSKTVEKLVDAYREGKNGKRK